MVNTEMLREYVLRESALASLAIMHDAHRAMGAANSGVLLGRNARVTWWRESLHLTDVQFADDASRDAFTCRMLLRMGPDNM